MHDSMYACVQSCACMSVSVGVGVCVWVYALVCASVSVRVGAIVQFTVRHSKFNTLYEWRISYIQSRFDV